MRTEAELDYLEKGIPVLAKNAIQKAYYDTLSAGLSVVESIDGSIYEIFPNGSKKFIKKGSPEININDLQRGGIGEAELLKFTDNRLSFFDVSVNSYFASVVADFIRQKLLEKKISLRAFGV